MNNRSKLSRALSLLLVFALFIGVLALPTQSAFAVPDENMPIDLGEVGAGVFAHITGGRTKPLTLTVYVDTERQLQDWDGQDLGVMYWYDPEYSPWKAYKNSIEKIVVEAGVTFISVYAFCDMPKVTEVHLPGTLVGVGAYAFYGTKPTVVYFDGTLKQFYDTVDYNINLEHSGEGNDTILNANIICSQEMILSGWQWIGNKWYYYSPTYHVPHKGWLELNGTWYYFNKDGSMHYGWLYYKDQWYFLGYPGEVNSGAMQKGWIQVNAYWYYMSSTGAMLTGWQTINGKTYYLKPSGAMAAREYINGWWLNTDGSWTYPYRATWRKGSKGWWYGDDSGWYARSSTYIINDKAYTFDASGWWIEE